MMIMVGGTFGRETGVGMLHQSPQISLADVCLVRHRTVMCIKVQLLCMTGEHLPGWSSVTDLSLCRHHKSHYHQQTERFVNHDSR
jgi:hypothetical protein